MRHSGSLARRRRRRFCLAALVASCLGLGLAPVRAQGEGLSIDLRSGRKLVAQRLVGDQASGYVATVGGQAVRFSHADLVAIQQGAAAAPELLRFELVGGERVFGAIVGGDADGDEVRVLSPVLGELGVPLDRLAAAVHPGVHSGDQVVPEGVDEALFLETPRGYDLVAGTLFRFGADGLEFQADGDAEARWYAPRKFSALRLRGGVDREEVAGFTLLTRSADRLGVTLDGCNEQGVQVTLEGGASALVAWRDVGCLVVERDVRHLSTMQPSEVVERGFDGPAVLRWQRDQSVAGGELVVRRRAYGRGLGVHSKSRLTYVVPDGATHFRAAVAFDDVVSALPLRAHAVARVARNREVLFLAEDLRPGAPIRDVGLHPVEPGDTITLEVEFGEGRDLGDRVDWLLPLFLMRRGA
ncbi:MAG: NPCBM/NEW2 domain-containing protein [Planctomycetota bacterium]|nr:NPCBM/NEW2 domain-containing protein [Planctomycetota bacterium]